MAQLWASFLVYATLKLLSCHHACSSLSPTSTSTASTPSIHSNLTDQLALLSFKSMIGSLALWNDSVHFCQWPGITCSGRRHPQRVISLELRSLNLAGFISPAIANLTFLRRIDLSNNQIRGPIPQEMGRLFRLQHLNLTANSLEEGIPASLSHCSKLQVLSLNHNMLQGEIPSSLASCLDLRIISLRNNDLGGNIPPPLTNLSSLSFLSIGDNHLSGGIPPTIGNLFLLTVLDLSGNQLLGGIPDSLSKLSKLTQLDLSRNHLSGKIATSVWNLSSLSHLSVAQNNLSDFLPSIAGRALPLLERIYLYNNQFHGAIPMSLSNASRLEIIDLSANSLTGSIPPNLGGLQNLQWLNLRNNQLEGRDGWGFLTALNNCTNLEKLQLDSNHLGGMMPNSIANFSTNLQKLTMASNQISGSISPEIGNLVSLTVLDMSQNLLKGSIPASIGMLKNMHALDLGTNKLSGEVPSTLGNLTQLNSLRLESNELRGIIPANLGNCQNLILLDLSFNKLTGGIPKEILTISTLSMYLNLAKNSLTGLIPSEVGSLKNLVKIDFSMNNLSGELPRSLGGCQELGKLYLSGNFFHGNISFLNIQRGMEELDLSRNNFSGKIPDFLQELPFLYYVNLSFNNFEGEVPRHGLFANTSAISIFGNTKLCGGNPMLYLPPCPIQKKHRFSILTIIISGVTTFACLFLLHYLVQKSRRESIIRLLRYRLGRKLSRESTVGTYELARLSGEHIVRISGHMLGRISYAQLVRATNGFSQENLLGVGSFGAVYKGTMEYDNTFKVFRFAVKVLNLQQRGASKSFMTECDILRDLVHRNIVRIYTTCSSVDSMGNDFKAIVFEFMANGSLDNWLHPITNEQCDSKRLNLIQRIDIAIDVASALDYLHHNHMKTIVHCDIKPSNILLDDSMKARVSDFGLARVPVETLIRSSWKTISTVGFRGTLGYVAPEYGTANKASTKGDVYSYGILLLEMFTGKRPTDGIFREGMSLRKYVQMALGKQTLDVIYASCLSGEVNIANEDAQSIFDVRIIKCVASIFRIGLSCSNEIPAHRPEMRNILKGLHEIRNMFNEDIKIHPD